MEILSTLALNIVPLYIIIALGYIGGRWMDVNLPSMATVAIYLIAPMVNLGAMMQLKFDPEYAALPVFVVLASSIIGLLTYHFATRRWTDSSANLISMSSVTGNTGYFGLPIVLALFGPEWTGVYLFMNVALIISELGLGYYFGARGHADVKGALKKVIKLPVIHAVWIGLLLNMADVEPGTLFLRYWNYAIGAWVIIGMMLIGIALGKQPKIVLDARLIKWLFTAKFVLWPLAAAMFIALDVMVFKAFDPLIYQMVTVFCTVPLAGNLVAYATNLNIFPERAAGAVLLSTLLALATIPAGLALLSLVL
jgi:malate permease and related proteins